MKIFYYILFVAGVFTSILGFYLWSQEGFAVPWGYLFDEYIRQTGTPKSSGIPTYFLLFPIGVAIVWYAWEEIGLKRWESDDSNT